MTPKKCLTEMDFFFFALLLPLICGRPLMTSHLKRSGLVFCNDRYLSFWPGGGGKAYRNMCDFICRYPLCITKKLFINFKWPFVFLKVTELHIVEVIIVIKFFCENQQLFLQRILQGEELLPTAKSNYHANRMWRILKHLYVSTYVGTVMPPCLSQLHQYINLTSWWLFFALKNPILRVSAFLDLD